jgi:hypothetical protein
MVRQLSRQPPPQVPMKLRRFLSAIRPRPQLVFALAIVLLHGATEIRAAKVQFERKKPHVNVAFAGHVVVADGLSFDVRADFEFGPGHAASGGMNVGLSDGSVKLVRATVATKLEGNQCLVIFLGGVPSGELDPTDPVVAIVGEDPARPGVVLVKLQANRLFQEVIEFAVPGKIELTKAESDPRRAAPLWFLSRHAPQRVTIEGTDMEIGFFSSVAVQCNHRARGRVALGLPDDGAPIFFEPLLGTSVPSTAIGPGYIIILMALKGAPLRLENLAIGTVHPHPVVPGCDIWDFSSNGVGPRGAPFHLVFEAEGETRIVRDCADRAAESGRSR